MLTNQEIGEKKFQMSLGTTNIKERLEDMERLHRKEQNNNEEKMYDSCGNCGGSGAVRGYCERVLA